MCFQMVTTSLHAKTGSNREWWWWWCTMASNWHYTETTGESMIFVYTLFSLSLSLSKAKTNFYNLYSRMQMAKSKGTWEKFPYQSFFSCILNIFHPSMVQHGKTVNDSLAAREKLWWLFCDNIVHIPTFSHHLFNLQQCDTYSKL